MNKEDIVIGQLVECCKNKSWVYGVIINIYDDRCEVKREYGGRIMYRYDKINMSEKEFKDTVTDDLYVFPLYKDGKPVLAKKTLFGTYKFIA